MFSYGTTVKGEGFFLVLQRGFPLPGINFDSPGATEKRIPQKELVFGNGCFLLAGSRSWKNISDVAGMAGFEPTISESKSGVLPLHYIPISGQKSSGIGITPNPRFRGVGKGVRTLDTRNHNPVLSRLSYTHHRSEMVRQEGFEPPAYCLEGSCSIRLSYWRAYNIWLPAQKVWSG